MSLLLLVPAVQFILIIILLVARGENKRQLLWPGHTIK